MFECIRDLSSGENSRCGCLTKQREHSVMSQPYLVSYRGQIWRGRGFKIQLLPPSDILAIGMERNRIQGGENSSSNLLQR